MPDTIKPLIRLKIQRMAWTAGTFGWHKSVVCKSLPRWASRDLDSWLTMGMSKSDSTQD